MKAEAAAAEEEAAARAKNENNSKKPSEAKDDKAFFEDLSKMFEERLQEKAETEPTDVEEKKDNTKQHVMDPTEAGEDEEDDGEMEG